LYQEFAYLYDILMDNIPYEEWCTYLCGLLREYGISDGLVAELGCGTGTMTELLAEAGYDMIGIDNSADMLDVAREKLYELDFEGEPPILYLEQDMRAFELFGTVRALVSVCDSMNYLLTEEDLLKVFRLANNYLDREGLFIFDMKTAYFYENIMGNRTITDVREDCAMIWDNTYEPQTAVNRYQLTLFSQTEDGLYERAEELHQQRAYTVETIKALIEQAGLTFVAAYDAFTHNPPTPTSERIYFIAREKEHAGKLYTS
jgi:SAM-dependent methyltransferase